MRRKKWGPSWPLAIGISLVIAIPLGIIIALADDSDTEWSPIGYGYNWAGMPGVHLTGEVFCDDQHRNCRGIVANDGTENFAAFGIVMGWKGLEAVSVKLGDFGPGQRLRFSIKLPSRPADITDFSIAFIDG